MFLTDSTSKVVCADARVHADWPSDIKEVLLFPAMKPEVGTSSAAAAPPAEIPVASTST